MLANNDIGLMHDTNRFLVKNFKMNDLENASFVVSILRIFLNYHKRTISKWFSRDITSKIVNWVISLLLRDI